MKSFTQKLLATIFLAVSMGQLAFADSQTEQPGAPIAKTKSLACVVMGFKADNSGLEILQQKEFVWDNKIETSEILFKEAELVYLAFSSVNSNNIAFSILNTTTKAISSAVGDLNQVLMLIDSSSNRVFGCGSDPVSQIKSMINAPSVK